MTTKTIDDQNLSQITYVGNWVRGGSPKEYNGTVASSTTVNDYFTVAFQGTSISVYGTVDATSGGVVTSYSLDGAPAAQVTSRAGSGDTYDQLFWSSPTLSMGDHKLIVNMVKVNPDPQPGEGTIWFDYFNVTEVPLPASSFSSSSSSSPSSTPTVAPAAPPPAAQKESNNIGPIIGGVVGGILILVLLVLLLLLYRRRRNRPSKNFKLPIEPEPHAPPVHPNLLVPNANHHTASTDRFLVTPNMHQGSSGYMVTLVPPPPMDYAGGGSSSHFTPSSSSSAFTGTGQSSHQGRSMYSVNPDHDAMMYENRKALEKGNEARKFAMPSAEPLQHADSGLRDVDPASIPASGRVELPPAYTPV
ncbi:hypothetical protein M413DRAFT_447758 [Hebeloma cylindrosporum]|uniref:Uncharacterized protein n=1 Tax=Hebeloma cylindrosporum TaxID=76867 RepID=A0A0C2XLB7_HEBCY|nr:hypothetical protein M413DRAFT_447758 [Hebeloma cylindrosporum h7]